jgi:hypothetical protein
MTDMRPGSPAATGADVVTAPAGWYDDPEGAGQRYWDGAQWTERRTEAPSSGEPDTPRAPTAKPDYWRRHPALLIFVTFLVGFCALAYAAIGIITVSIEDCTRNGVVVECQSENLTTTVNLLWTGVIALVGLLAVVRAVFQLRAHRAARK